MSTGWQPYQQWYPYFTSHVLHQFQEICQEAMNISHTVDAWCQKGATCIFNNINSYTQTELAGAGVMLGLAPATLGVVGPSDQSLAILSFERPLLSLMLASSTATLSVGYPFSRTSPLQPLADALETVWNVEDLIPMHKGPRPGITSALQYFLAAAATANTIHMSYDITRKTIVSWSCPNWAWVLCWSFVPLFLQVVTMIIYRYTITREARPTFDSRQDGILAGAGAQERTLWTWLMDREFRPCSQRVLPRFIIKYSFGTQILWWAPRVCTYLQYIMGTAIFSSLLFITIADAFPIIVRYAASSIVARCILGWEVQSLKRLNKPSHLEGFVSSPRYNIEMTGFNPTMRSRTVDAQVLKLGSGQSERVI